MSPERSVTMSRDGLRRQFPVLSCKTAQAKDLPRLQHGLEDRNRWTDEADFRFKRTLVKLTGGCHETEFHSSGDRPGGRVGPDLGRAGKRTGCACGRQDDCAVVD